MVFIGLGRNDAPATSVEEAKANEIIVAGKCRDRGRCHGAFGLNALIGTKFKVIRGYESAAANMLALQRGEVQGIGSSTGLADLSGRGELIEKKLVNVLYVMT